MLSIQSFKAAMQQTSENASSSSTQASTENSNALTATAATNQNFAPLNITTHSAASSTQSLPLSQLAAATNLPNQTLVNDLAGILQTGAEPAALTSRWNEFIAEVGTEKGALVDINALVQAVLREAYSENTKDLHFYAQKVKYFNEVKKAIRNQLTDMRDVLSQYAGAEDNTALNPPYTYGDIATDYFGQTTVQTGAEGQVAGSGIVSMQPASPGLGDTITVELESGWTVEINPNDNGATTELKIYDEEGSLVTRIWGDPHVDNGGDGSDWHFGDDSTFILPDGTKLCLNCKRTSNENDDEDIWVCHGVDIISGNQHLGMGLNPDEVNGAEEYRTPQMTQDGLAWDQSHLDASSDSNAGVFTWSADHNEWAMLNDGQFHVVQDESWSDYKSSGDVSTTGQAIIANSNITLALQGDPNVCANFGELDTAKTGLEEKLNSVGDDAQLANVDLQNMLQKQQQTLQMISNIGKMLHDTAMAVIRKIGG